MLYYFGRKGGHYLRYESVPPGDIQINRNARVRIVHTPLTLHCGSFSEWCCDGVASYFAYKGWQYYGNMYSRPSWTRISLLTWLKFLTLCWRPFSEWSRDRVAVFCAHKGFQYVGYLYSRANWISINSFTWPEFFDTPLTLIFRMGKWLGCYLFCL